MKTFLSAVALVALAVLVAPASGGAAEGCTCRANGQDYEEGTILCIRGRLARCEMAINNTNWKFISDICPMTRGDKFPVFAWQRPDSPSSLPAC